MTKRIALLAAIISLVGISCEMTGYEKTKTGLRYKIFHGSDNKNKGTLRPGSIVKFNYLMTINDSVLASSYETVPGYDMVDSNPRPHDFSEILTKLSIGDSAVTYQFFDTLAKLNPGQMPPFLKKGSKIKMTIKIIDTIANGMAGVQEEESVITAREIKGIERYIDVKKLNAQKLNTVYVVVENKGNGPAVDSGKYVGIKYTGYTTEVKYFDSNVDSTKQEQKHPMETFYFFAKQGGAINGMLEGVTAFNKGGKGKLIIPSTYAYGRQGGGNVIKPYQTLIFDIEVVDVKDSVQQMQPMPPMPQ